MSEILGTSPRMTEVWAGQNPNRPSWVRQMQSRTAREAYVPDGNQGGVIYFYEDKGFAAMRFY